MAALNHKLWTMFLITFTFMFVASIVVYWRLTQDEKAKSRDYHLPTEVKYPPSLPTFKPARPSLSKDIYFVETSERTNPNFMFMCAVESAARTHPESRIFVLMKGLTNYSLPLPKRLGFSLLGFFPNVEFRPLDVDDLFSETPLADWYLLARQRWEPHFIPILSDACRIAIMWKFGGIYLDTDLIVLKNLNSLTNVLGTQSKYILNGAFLSFEPKHEFIGLCIQDFVADYSRWLWGHQGPQLLTRNFKRWCSIRSLHSRKNCRGVTVLPREAFYPIRWQDWAKYFEAINASELPKLFENTYAVHIWNMKSQGKKLNPGTLLDRLQSSFCPSTYSLRTLSS